MLTYDGWRDLRDRIQRLAEHAPDTDEGQMAAIEASSMREIRLSQVRRERDLMLQDVADDEELARQAKVNILSVIAGGDLWFMQDDLAQLVGLAARQMPRHTLEKEHIPSSNGLCFFAWPFSGLRPMDDSPLDVSAVTWGEFRNGEVAGQDGLWLISWSSFVENGKRVWAPTSSATWYFGKTQDFYDGKDRADETLANYVSAIWAIAVSPGVCENSTEHATRQMRRNGQRAGLPVPDIKIIRLRSSSHPTEAGRQAETKYLRRWIVSGHIRMQPYGPGRQLRRPTFIAPHVKGPEDAPLYLPEQVRVV